MKVRLGNNRLNLSSEDIYVLCDIVDSYATKYIECISTIEGILKSHSFSLSKRKNNYKLINLNYNHWREIISFTFKHDVGSGKSEWYIFDRNNHFIKVYTENKHVKYDLGYHAFFHAEFSEDMIFNPELASKKVCVTFEFIEDLDRRGVESINESGT